MPKFDIGDLLDTAPIKMNTNNMYAMKQKGILDLSRNETKSSNENRYVSVSFSGIV